MTEGYASGSSDGITVTSNADSAETIASVLEAPDKVSEAASELGKRGGKASAEKRASVSTDGRSTGDISEASGSPEGSGDAEAEAEPEKPLGKPRDDPKARMLEATRKEAEAKREAKELKAENERLKRQFESYRPEPAPQAQQEPRQAPHSDDPEPDIANYDNYEQYVKESARWAGRQEVRAYQNQMQERQQIERIAHGIAKEVETDISSFQTKWHEAAAADPEAVASIPEFMLDLLEPSWMLPPGTPKGQANAIADEVMKLDNPVKVLAALAAENGKEFQRLATLSSAPAITRALARLDAKYDGPGAATPGTSPKPKVSAAKPPVRPVTGAPSVVVDELSDDLPYEEHRRIMNAREQKARAQR